MPMYEFACPKCGAKTDIMILNVNNRDENTTMCLPCWEPMKRQLPIPALRGGTVART
jgi:predicted nucleic acid-binding Zn ribbon protein